MLSRRTGARPRPHDAPAAPERPMLPLWAAVLSAALAGVLMDLAFPSVGLWPCAFVAVGLLLLALDGRRIGGAILVSAVYGAVFFPLLVFWATRYLGAVPWLGLAGAETVLTSVALVPIALAYRWLPRAWPGARSVLLPVVVGALWAMYELFLGNWPYGGFPWARLGMTQSQGPMAPVVSWIGVTGLSFLMVTAVALIIECVRASGWRRPIALVAPAATVAILLLTPLFPTSSTGAMRIGAVQGNGTTGFFDDREPYGVIEAQTRATEPLIGEEVDLLVWPEGGVDYDPFQDSATARMLTRVSARVDAPLLANTATERGDNAFNTSFVWNEDGATGQTHDKRHPVPFGEYVPNREFFNALAPDLVGLLTREYTPGSNSPTVEVGGIGVGLAICFDVIYDEVIRESVGAGAEVLVFQTNNADFRGTDENLQQLAFARMRAMETGRSVVNVSTVGTSQVIRPDGSTVSSLDANEAGALLEDVELRSGLTAGVVLGPWVQLVLALAGPAALVAAYVGSRRRP
ncbi:apolipoprotein N-acyltransferase [Microbacterium sp.]|uniref:apolipoprotein N-acyltransferase n=1 Tax=Microbacterium sp. TaxID=51671 RepID=UPI002810C1BC|nr:apolipoprotein N-acyltransferase [Microbacterium sp.]